VESVELGRWWCWGGGWRVEEVVVVGCVTCNIQSHDFLVDVKTLNGRGYIIPNHT
jgi:hypothetical protein